MAKNRSKTLDELFHDTLKRTSISPRRKFSQPVPRWSRRRRRPSSKRRSPSTKTETEGHVARLEKVFAAIDKKPQGKTCDAIVGITDEGAEIMKEYKGSPALDAPAFWRRRRRWNTMKSPALRHALKTWASELGLNEAVQLLEQTLAEEKKTDATLSQIAESAVNQEATNAAHDAKMSTRKKARRMPGCF